MNMAQLKALNTIISKPMAALLRPLMKTDDVDAQLMNVADTLDTSRLANETSDFKNMLDNFNYNVLGNNAAFQGRNFNPNEGKLIGRNLNPDYNAIVSKNGLDSYNDYGNTRFDGMGKPFTQESAEKRMASSAANADMRLNNIVQDLSNSIDPQLTEAISRIATPTQVINTGITPEKLAAKVALPTYGVGAYSIYELINRLRGND